MAEYSDIEKRRDEIRWRLNTAQDKALLEYAKNTRQIDNPAAEELLKRALFEVAKYELETGKEVPMETLGIPLIRRHIAQLDKDPPVQEIF